MRNTLLGEIGAFQRDHILRLRDVVYPVITEGHKQAVGDELDVLAHQCRVHADQLAWQVSAKQRVSTGKSEREMVV
jgi:hypothetical protein